ncbi:hypothetical protein KY284_010266 [Solanum tuberosum]|nr:hypothetical protein KY284_010266 [Solanum tuberosum]
MLGSYKTAKAMLDYLQKQYLVTQNAFKKENDVIVAFAAQGKGNARDMIRTQCYSSKNMVILLAIVARRSDQVSGTIIVKGPKVG